MFDPRVQLFGPAGRLQDRKVELLDLTPICGQKRLKYISLANKQNSVQKFRRVRVGAGVCGRVRVRVRVQVQVQVQVRVRVRVWVRVRGRVQVGAVGCGLARVRVEARERGEPCSCYRPPELPLLLGAGTV